MGRSVSDNDRGYGVLLVAYGAPERLEDVEPYLLDVRGGRPTSPALVEELKGRYAAIGGRSPLRDNTEAQAAALAHRLGDGTPVYVGMRHWHPYIGDTMAEIRADGVTRIVALALAPHFSSMSIGAYQRKIEEGRGSLDVALVREWHDHPLFLDAVADRVRAALVRFPHGGADTRIVCTAHSLPQRILGDGDPYVGQLQASVAGVAERLGGRDIVFGYQSAGRSDEPWLGPDAAEVIRRLAAEGAREVLLCPVGFVSDHLEVLYDVDIEYQALAGELGIRLERTESLNDDPFLTEALYDLVRRTARAHGWPG